MPLTFYPYSDDLQKGTIEERIDILMEAAERYKAVVLETTNVKVEVDPKRRSVPREMTAAFNWDEIARVFREIRDLPEISKFDKTKKADLLTKLSEVYEVLRAAKMSKLEAVRLALINEAAQLRGA